MTRKRANSLKITTFILSLCLLLWSCTPNSPALVPPETRGTGDQFGIIGQVVDRNSNPATGAYIYAYRNMRSNLRGPADFEALVDAKGLYFLDMVEGDYYLVARMRQSGADAGPPKAGDAWALPTKNPVSVKPRETSTVNFVLQGISQPLLMREGTLTSGDTGFTGLLVDSNDKPLTGAFAIAYPEANYQRMPEATSATVGEDGRFHLYVERIGQWCLAARTRTRGQPIAGEPYGKLGEAGSGCRKVVTGKIIDVGTIRLTPYRQ